MGRQKPIALQQAINFKLRSKQVGSLIKQAIRQAERRKDGKKWNQRLLAEHIGTSEDILSRGLLGKIHLDPITITQITTAINVGVEFTTTAGPMSFGVHDGVSSVVSADETITDAKKVEEKHTRGKKRK